MLEWPYLFETRATIDDIGLHARELDLSVDVASQFMMKIYEEMEPIRTLEETAYTLQYVEMV